MAHRSCFPATVIARCTYFRDNKLHICGFRNNPDLRDGKSCLSHRIILFRYGIWSLTRIIKDQKSNIFMKTGRGCIMQIMTKNAYEFRFRGKKDGCCRLLNSRCSHLNTSTGVHIVRLFVFSCTWIWVWLFGIQISLLLLWYVCTLIYIILFYTLGEEHAREFP